MWVLAPSPDIVGRFEGEQGGWQVGLDKGDRACIFQQAHHWPIFSVWFPSVRREADGDVEALHLNGVLERDGNAGQRPLQVALLGRPFLGFGKEDLGRAVGLLLRFQSDLAVSAQDVDGAGDALLHILHEVLYGLAEDRALLWRQRIAVGCR